MTSHAAPLEQAVPTLPAAGTPARRGRMIAWAAAAAGIGLAWLGGPVGTLGAAAGAAALAWSLRSGAVSAAAGPAPDPAEIDGTVHNRVGAEVMVTAIVPVWQRQILASRDVADQGLTSLLESFNGFAGALDELAKELGSAAVGASPGAIDEALQTEGSALAALLAPSRRAFAERDAAVAELSRCAAGLQELQPLVKQAREIARHTRLVAFNASIEAQRTSRDQGGGTQAVAGEVRMLSGRMAETAEQIDRLSSRLLAGATQATRSGEIGDTSDEELRLEPSLRAREALAALLGALGASMHGTVKVQTASAELRTQIDDAYTHFQFGDRVSQMLAIVANDMSHLAEWVRHHPYATQSDAGEWLTALEASYTMEEQRSQHHGNVHVAGEASVEFF